MPSFDWKLLGQRVWQGVLMFMIAAPPLYLFFAIQYGAITVPYWDHVNLITFIDKYYNGTLAWADLWSPVGHARPLTYRLIYVINAALTGWDIRSEYIYMYLAIYGAFLVHVSSLRRLTALGLGKAWLPALAILTVLYFAPTGHHNHWWSLLLILNLGNLFILLALLGIAFDPDSWRSNIVAAIFCLLATYSITNGLVAFIAVALVRQLTRSRPLAADRFSIFWIVVIAGVMALYLPGLIEGVTKSIPSPWRLVWFTLAYLGSPIVGFVDFPYTQWASVGGSVLPTGLVGLLLLAATATLLWSERKALAEARPGLRIFLACWLFAIGSALLTAWGRTDIDPVNGLRVANISRYIIFSSYLLFALIYYAVELQRDAVVLPRVLSWLRDLRHPAKGSVLRFLVVCVAVLGIVTYSRGTRIYVSSYNHNLVISKAFAPGVNTVNVDPTIHPSPEMVRYLRVTMARLELGPFRYWPTEDVMNIPRSRTSASPAGFALKEAWPLYGERMAVQRFVSPLAGLKEIEVLMVTWAQRQEPYRIDWTLWQAEPKRSTPVATGQFDSMSASDWGTVALAFNGLEDSKGKVYELEFRAQPGSKPEKSIGFPLYVADPAFADEFPVRLSDQAAPRPLTLHMNLHYR